MKKILHFIFISIFTFLLAGCGDKKESLKFKISPEEAMLRAVAGNQYISMQAYRALARGGEGDVLLVDLRPAGEFEKGHLENAVNMPVPNLLDDEYFSALKESKHVVLYGEEMSQANGPWLLLTQLGLDHVKMLRSDYDGVVAGADTISPETARYDYAAIFQKAVERHKKEVEAGIAKPAVVTQPAAAPKKVIVPEKKPEKKVVEEEEGC